MEKQSGRVTGSHTNTERTHLFSVSWHTWSVTRGPSPGAESSVLPAVETGGEVESLTLLHSRPHEFTQQNQPKTSLLESHHTGNVGLGRAVCPWASVIPETMASVSQRHGESARTQQGDRSRSSDAGGPGGGQGKVTKMDRTERSREKPGPSNLSRAQGARLHPRSNWGRVRGASKQEKDTLHLCFQNTA